MWSLIDAYVNIANKAGASLKHIIQAVEKNTALIHDVSTGSRQTNEGIQQLAAASEQIVATIQQVSGAAQELAGIATELQNTVIKFKVDETISAPGANESSEIESDTNYK